MWARTKHIVLIVFISLIALSGLYTSAQEISNKSDQCADLLMLFARGSSSNPQALNIDEPFSNDFMNGVPDPENPGKKIGGEEIPGAFFQWMEKRIKADYPNINYKAISIHNAGRGWSPNGYPAVGIFNPSTFNNVFEAEFFWWPFGEYRSSVESGARELAGRVNYETTECPNQRIVIGGYSQGAHVVGDALFKIPQNQRNLIDNVALFGDPKFISANYNKFNILDSPKAYPWYRGTAGLRERGINDARVPYVPDDMARKTISWCHEDDFICTGYSGMSWAALKHMVPAGDSLFWKDLKGAFGAGHTRYPLYGVPEATEEILANLEPWLAPINKNRSGLSVEKIADPVPPPPAPAEDESPAPDPRNYRKIDLMFAFNFTGGMEDAQFVYLVQLPDIITQHLQYYPELAVGSMLYTDMWGSSGPHQSSIAVPTRKPAQLVKSPSGLYSDTHYLFGGLGGGGDYPENHGMAIERAGMFANWRPDSVRRIVLFAERPALEEWSFEMCDSAILEGLKYTGPSPCQPGGTISTTNHPELCESIQDVLEYDACPYGSMSSTTNTIFRNLDDVIALAQAKGFVIDVIQPHEARDNQSDYPPLGVSEQLKSLAEGTGGLYLKYSSFSEPEMRDAMWQILNHTPQIMRTGGFEIGSLLNFLDSPFEPALPRGFVRLPLGAPALLTTRPISGAQSYGWDINDDGTNDFVSDGPSLEFIPSQPRGTIRIQAYQGPSASTQLSQTTIVYSAATPSSSGAPYIPGVADGLSTVSAQRQASGSVVVSWSNPSTDPYALVLVRDAQGGEPIISAPASLGQVTLNLPSNVNSLLLERIAGGSEAVPQLVSITPYQPPTNPQDNVGQTDTKVVSQKEPQTSSAQILATSLAQTPLIQLISQNNAGLPIAGTTIVRGAEDVKTNPQGEVGDINAVNSLFPGEVLGGQPAQTENSRGRAGWLVLLIILIILGVILGYYLYKKSDDEVTTTKR